LNGSLCQDGVNSFTCNCDGTGFDGTFCQSPVDDCQNHACLNGGACVDQHKSYLCDCTATGFEGPYCAQNVDDCSIGACSNGGVCVDGLKGFDCVCTDTGFTGPLCGENVDDCFVGACLNGGACLDGVNQYSCDCSGTGFFGGVCENNVNDCVEGACQNGGQCLDEVLGYSCDCADTGFQGVYCQINIDDCYPGACLNGGLCLDEVLDYSCDCAGTGFQGPYCDVNINDCVEGACANLGLCVDGVSSYTCDCAGTGFTGADCTNNTDDCFLGACENSGLCVDGVNGFSCDCANTGYIGQTCDVDFDECTENNGGCGDPIYYACSNQVGVLPTCSIIPHLDPVNVIPANKAKAVALMSDRLFVLSDSESTGVLWMYDVAAPEVEVALLDALPGASCASCLGWFPRRIEVTSGVAAISSAGGLEFLDVSGNSLNPIASDFPEAVMQIHFKGSSLYAATTGEGMRAFDMSTPAVPTLSAVLDLCTDVGCNEDNWPYDLYATDSHIFLAATDGGVHVYDLGLNWITTFGGEANRVTGSGDHLYVASSNDLHVYDISSPGNPSLLTTLVGAGTLHGDLDLDGTVLFVTDTSMGIFVVDVSTPANPSVLVHDVLVGARDAVRMGNYIFVPTGFNVMVYRAFGY
jgi:hypothetical protein